MMFWVFQQGYANEVFSPSENIDWPGFHDSSPWGNGDCPARFDHASWSDIRIYSLPGHYRLTSPWDEAPPF